MKKVLVVDDEKSIRNTLKVFLEDEGYDVCVAEDADEAITLIQTHSFDVIVTDIILPRITGVELLQSIRNESPYSKIIMMTGEPTIETSTQSLRLGAFDYLFKPIAKKKILKAVKIACNTKELEDEKRQLQKENQRYQEKLEHLVEERTRSLMESEQRLRIILESIPVCIVTIDRESRKIVDANPYAVEMTGVEKKNLIGTNCFDVICRAEKGKCPIIDFGKKQVTSEGIVTGKKDRKFNVLKTVTKMTIGDKHYLLESFIDITEKKSLENQLHQAQKLEAIGNLAGGIAHDFNNILSIIIGYAQIELSKAAEGSELEDSMKEILVAGNRAKDLVQQILTYARKSEEDITPVRVDIIVKEALKFIRSSIPANIEILSNIVKTTSKVMGNQTQIHQIFMNLLTNAAHAMEKDGGVLRVDLEECQINRDFKKNNFLKSGNYIIAKISDTGHGIPSSIMNSIFDPYFTTKEKEKGTGLGLSVVLGIIKSYDGEISVSSQEGKGSCFTVYLPITKTKDEHKIQKSEDIPAGNERILLIDDEVSITKAYRTIFEKLGYVVTTINDSRSALELFKSKTFDLVLTDMAMPHITGDKLSMAMKGIRPQTPIIIYTGYSKKLQTDEDLENRADAILKKPLDISTLGLTVRKLLDDAISHKNK